jgi:hypothetical protein
MTQIIALVGLLQYEHGFDIRVIEIAWRDILRENPEPPALPDLKAYYEHKDLCWSRLARHFGLIK